MWNIIIGLIFVVGAFSGQLVLRGTDSSMGLGILGAGLILWGVWDIAKQKKGQDAKPQKDEDAKK